MNDAINITGTGGDIQLELVFIEPNIFAGIFIIGVAVTGVLTGYKVMDYLIKKSVPLDTIESDRKKLIQDYEKGFLKELEALEDREISKETLVDLESAKLETETPFGNVIMVYNADAETFFYYTENKNIPYKTLDAVARQFAVEHNCKRICVNYKEEWEKAKAAAQAQQDADDAKDAKDADDARNNNDTEDAESKPRNVFVKFKKYNNTCENVQDVKTNNDIKNKKRKDSIKRRKYRIMPEKTNRFTHKGRLDDFYNRQNTTNQNVETKPLSFAEFKAAQQLKENEK